MTTIKQKIIKTFEAGAKFSFHGIGERKCSCKQLFRDCFIECSRNYRNIQIFLLTILVALLRYVSQNIDVLSLMEKRIQIILNIFELLQRGNKLLRLNYLEY